MPEERRLPETFLLGTATAGLQIEGGPARNSWYRWADQGHIKDGSHPSRANDHWRRYEEDVELIRRLGSHTHRLGVEWARIEPDEGVFDADALARCRREIELLRDAGVIPLVTLHHFTNPLWVEDDGGWLDERIVDRFERYVRHVVGELCDLVTDWVTINEPNIYLLEGYVLHEWPPGRSSLVDYLRGTRRMIEAHRAAYTAIHEIARERAVPARAGVAHHVRVFDPAGGFVASLLARMIEHLVQGVFLDGTINGTRHRRDRGASGPGRFSDFLGINYYTRDIVRPAWAPAQGFARREVAEGRPTNDLGWEIYPEGLSRLVERYATKYSLPVWITENGIPDSRDELRASFITAHLNEVAGLVARGINVERYYYWTLVDNFEWVEGEAARFGLYHCDFETQERRLRESGKLYREICRTRRFTPGDI